MNIKKNLNKNFLLKILKLLGVGFLFCMFFALILFVYYSKDLPRPELFEERQLAQPTKIYDKTGKVLLYTIYGEEKREYVKLADIPQNVINALIATEDKNFYTHHGVDIKGIFRSILINFRIKKATYGASTLSQQLIRSTFLTLEKSIGRKIKELVLTIELERNYEKNQILEWYLNQIPIGTNVYGIREASRHFFNKELKDLTLAESASIIAAIKATSYYSPYGKNVEALLGRKDYVLSRMLDEKYITKEQYQEALKQKLIFEKPKTAIKAPHFVLYVRDYLLEQYGEDYLKENGLKVITTLDWDIHEKTEKILKNSKETIKAYNANNIASVIIDPNNGDILSMIGSRDYFDDPYPEECIPGANCLFEPDVNVAIYGLGQQPGSALKPFAYLTAFEMGYTADTKVLDIQTNFGNWGGNDYIPRNYDGLFRGEVTLREALAQSLNIPSIKVFMQMAGMKNTIETARDCGITTLTKPSSEYGPSLVLGGGEVKLLDMASAYGVFASEGLKYAPRSILRIEDYKGNIISQKQNIAKRVATKEACQMLNNVLSDNEARAPIFGRNSSLYFADKKVSVKTGTTDSYKDDWAIGYTDSVVVGIWVGNNNNEPMAKKAAVAVAGPIWHNIMDLASDKYFSEPSE
ncbi:MAG: transglycosylase domain-containing protein [Candidatus Pacebacteria bacterium]|nr:transglycosylase domain-containing protein [Candidatus Paceibacterota bacterium]